MLRKLIMTTAVAPRGRSRRRPGSARADLFARRRDGGAQEGDAALIDSALLALLLLLAIDGGSEPTGP